MNRPDLHTLACVNPECQGFNQPGRGKLTVRKGYGVDRLRLLRCKECQEEFSERRGTAFFNTKIPEARAVAVIEHLDEGNSLTATARLVKVAGRHAQRFHARRAQGLQPAALEFDEQWAFVKKSNGAAPLGKPGLATRGSMSPLTPRPSWWWPWRWASARQRKPASWFRLPKVA